MACLATAEATRKGAPHRKQHRAPASRLRTPSARRQKSVALFRCSQAKFSFLGEGMVIRWAAAGSISAHWWMPTAETPNIYHPLVRRHHAIVLAPSVLSFMHWHTYIISLSHSSQLQLKASLSLHCVPNRGLPFLVETIVMKTARHEG